MNPSIKGVPDEIAERRRQRAARNHLSLQGERMAIIEPAAAGPATQHPGVMQSCAQGWKSSA